MEKYIPDMYQKSIYSIDYSKIKERGIKCLLFDLDNTIAPLSLKKPNRKIKAKFQELKEMNFKIIIFSNNSKNRLKPFKDELEVDCAANAKKPNQQKFLTVIKNYKLKASEVAIIGDQILTDIVGGNKVGITTILVNPISKRDRLNVKMSRLLEKIIIKKLSKKELFFKGKYYE